MSKWAYSFDNEGYYGGFESKEDAIKEGMAEAKDCGYNKLFVGEEVCNFAPSIDVDNVIEQIQENAYDYSEYADHYLDDVKKEHREVLEEKLNDVLIDWIYKLILEVSQHG